MSCACGFSKDYPICDNTHSLVRTVKDRIINQITDYFVKTENDKINLEDLIDIIKRTKGPGINP